MEVDDVEDSNEWPKLATEQLIRREKIQSNVKIMVALTKEIKVL